MTQSIQCHSWKRDSKQNKTMNGNYISVSSRTKYLVESFTLNSVDRIVTRKGKGRIPHPSFRRNDSTQIRQLALAVAGTGKKVSAVDLQTLVLHFENYVKAVNMILEKVYRTPQRAEQLGKKLSEYRGKAHSLLREEKNLCYQHNDEFKKLVFERLHRNALEQAGRIIFTDWTRRQLLNAAIEVLSVSEDDIIALLRSRRITSPLIRKVRESCETMKKNSSWYHYALGIMRHLRAVLDRHILKSLEIKISWRVGQRKKISSILRKSTPERQRVINLVKNQVQIWKSKGYPFEVPKIRNYSLDFSASTENTPGQGYWFTLDPDRENEILFHLKLPPGIDGTHQQYSPFKAKTLTFRFLNWLPRAAAKDRRKAAVAGDAQRAEMLSFRAAKFEDMHQQLMNTIQLQHVTYRLLKLKNRKNSDIKEIIKLQQNAQNLRESRRSAPPRLLLRNHRVTLQISFLSPNGEVSFSVLGERKYDSLAGADRGLRAPVAVSVEKDSSFIDMLVNVAHLLEKRERLRNHISRLTSEIMKKKDNWERKRPGLSCPVHIRKKDRHVDALWNKIRRLDREMARQVASQTVWFCEEHRVRRLFFEDLRSFQAPAGSKDLSWSLSANLWGKIIETVRYMRESLGHSKYSVWTVNPRYTSQTCHQCGERGIRVADENSTAEQKGGEFFYCLKCSEHFHADINAARNIIHVQQPSAVPGRTA